MKTILNEFKEFIERENFENNNWYRELKKWIDILQGIKKEVKKSSEISREEFEDSIIKVSNGEIKTTNDFLERYFFIQSNGIANVGQGNIYDSIKNNDRAKLREKVNSNISLLINILLEDNVIEANKLLEKLLDVNIKNRSHKAVRLRFMCTLFPEDFTTISSEDKIYDFKNKLERIYRINLSNNVLEIQNQFMNELKSIDEEVYKKLVFYWYLYERLCGNSSGEEIWEVKEDEKKYNNEKINLPLNQILYGPPGTGKTYNTINKAVEIIDKEFYLNVINSDIDEKEKS